MYQTGVFVWTCQIPLDIIEHSFYLKDLAGNILKFEKVCTLGF